MTTVSVIIATRNRPEMVREAIAAVLNQTFSGVIEVLVVYDQSEPDGSLAAASGTRTVRVIRNVRSAGLAGARNSGIQASTGDYVAFCDDDDYWKPGKLAAQIQRLENDSAVDFVTCGIAVHYDGQTHDRPLSREVVTFQELLRDRHTELHPSTFLMRRSAVVDGFGLVDEAVPGGFGEDYEFLLRASRSHSISHVREPLTVVRWGGQSYFFRKWQTMSDGLSWVLAKYPEFESSPAGSARIRGQIAFAHAAGRNRSSAVRWAASAIRRNPLEPRASLALAVATGLLSPDRVMTELHKRGRGI
ncbi:glycosyltransferase family 2 protein [Paenarthrobacter sp. Z7-10]|uniref:glycosyltransferase family 2 protein n=1 Tax=Paenarthrobacter sp. Z7-10 TaxID=2787635 RepID=UPI0022A92EDC|nr:glycosyltransferase family 2 protein [Paenarthrobacter sp. Z7-10]MCZ2402947.1 glycosyltransferase family 2 protein [Paenarthrobacter sp. Z7-10]